MGRRIVVATCALNQWALDYEGNLKRIVESVHVAKGKGATYRTGPELEITGYGCADHFYEQDTIYHSWESIGDLLRAPGCKDIIIDVGMPVMHKNVTYSCRIVILNKRIILIRPKMILSDDGLYNESRWFTAWQKPRCVQEYVLPKFIQELTKQVKVPFGDAIINTLDTCIGYEICEELFNPESPHIPMTVDGVEIFVNSAAYYSETHKCEDVHYLIKSATQKCGGCYLFANQKGCDGDILYYPGNASIALNGELVGALDLYTLTEVDVITATIDLEGIRSYRRANRSLPRQSSKVIPYPRLQLNFSLSDDNENFVSPSDPVLFQSPCTEEEILYGPACWLWDYLRRSEQGGFLLALSGGADSAATSVVVYSMCTMVVDAIHKGNKLVLDDVRRILGQNSYRPKTPRDLCNQLLHTVYLSTDNSTKKSKDRAKKLAQQIGSYHLPVAVDLAVSAILGIFSASTGKIPKYLGRGGGLKEHSALQNVQSRVRMIISYLFAQLLLWVRQRPGGLLVLGSSNVDECLRGYMTKYGSSSADINPIGGFSKDDLAKCLLLAKERLNIPILEDIVKATPSSELVPLVDGISLQNDVDDMGMTHDELSLYGKLRKIQACGPYAMFCRLMNLWTGPLTQHSIGEKVKIFFRHYSVHRHKMTILTPSYHGEPYASDERRFDLRPMVYNVQWTRQFKAIDNYLDRLDRLANDDISIKEEEESIYISEDMVSNELHDNEDMIEDSLVHITQDSIGEDMSEEEEPKNQSQVKTSKKGKKYYKHKFQKKWMEVEEWKPWLRPSKKGLNYFYCTVCVRDVNGGTYAVKKHSRCTKHLRNMDESPNQPQYIVSMPAVELKTEDEIVHQIWI